MTASPAVWGGARRRPGRRGGGGGDAQGRFVTQHDDNDCTCPEWPPGPRLCSGVAHCLRAPSPRPLSMAVETSVRGRALRAERYVHSAGGRALHHGIPGRRALPWGPLGGGGVPAPGVMGAQPNEGELSGGVGGTFE